MALELELLTQPLESVLDSAITILPGLAASIILLLIGWAIGSIIGRVAKEIMLRFKIDQYISKKGAMIKLSDIFPLMFQWIMYLVFIKAAVEALGIQALIEFVGMILNFIPGLLGAIIVVIVGYAIAGYIQKGIEKSKIAYSDIMGNVIFWLTVYVSFAIALPLVNIDATLINNLLLISVGSIGVGLAIAIGLGLKDIIAIIAKRKLRKFMR
jgi:hypothetical protein